MSRGRAMLKAYTQILAGFFHLLCLRSQSELGLKLLQGSMVSQVVLSSPTNRGASAKLFRQPSSATIGPGKAFESMNMDEFMKNLWNTEDSKVGVGALTSFTTENNGASRQRHQSQATSGEMTLEDFLVRTGAVRDDPDAGSHTSESSKFYPSASTASAANGLSSTMEALVPSLQHDWVYRPHQHQQLLHHAEAVAAAKRGFQTPSLVLPTGSPMYDGLADSAVSGPEGFANSLALSPSFSDFSMHSRKRLPCNVPVEKTMERRQKRMIKNRESAARSRARKQAYTVELEAELTLLKEENARLKQQQRHLPEAMCGHITRMKVLRRTQSY